ncbi:hypothetical protein AgCh_036538 [Apium graveolens]
MDNGLHERLIVPKVQEEGEIDLKSKVWQESKDIWRVALPGIISRVGSFGTIVITQSFVGHISPLDLAGYALVQTITVRFVNGILLGMSSATETLCGQAFGAGQYHMMGIYLQRSWIVDLITLTILLPVFIFGSQIFMLLGQDESIAKRGGYISLLFIPFVYYFVFSLTIQMYLQAQLKNKFVAWISLFQFILHVPLSWLFVSYFSFGVAGAMSALIISSWFLVIGMFVYIFGGWCPQTWKGFSKAALSDILPVVKLSLSSGLMVCLELWYNALLVLIAGYMDNAEVAISAFSICLNINGWEFMICLGFLGAACVRVANELGKGNANAVRFSIKVLVATSLLIDLSVLLGVSVFLNSIYPVLSGVAVGAGLQGTIAIVNLVCYYLIGIPVGIFLGYVVGLQVKGIWIGMICGIVCQTTTVCVITWRTNWDVQVQKASERLNRFYVKSGEETNQSSNHA